MLIHSPTLISISYMIAALISISIGSASGDTIGAGLSILAAAPIVAIAIGWPFSLYLWLGRILKSRNENVSAVGEVVFIITVISIISLLILSFYTGDKFYSDRIQALHLFFVLFSVLALFWVSAKRISKIEGPGRQNFFRNFLGFVQIFYLPIGIFFIFSRLKEAKVV